MESVVGEGRCGADHTEGLSQRVPRLLAEDGVHQLDDLVLLEDRQPSLNVSRRGTLRAHRWRSYLLQRRLHVHVVRQRIRSRHKHGGGLQSLLKLEVDATEIVQTSCEIL